MTTDAQTQAQTFLHELFGNKPTAAHVLVWTLPDKISGWFTSVDDAAEYAVKRSRQDVYVGVGLSATDNGRKVRCKADNVSGIVGLWADVDVADPVHKKAANLPPDVPAALALLADLQLAPTMIVHSGHGLQAWWCFDEPWIFADDAERAAAAELSESWNYALSVKAASRGYVVDSTFDLSRVMRVPGTHNCKSEPRVPVTMQVHDGARHTRKQLGDAVCALLAAAPPKVKPTPPKKADPKPTPPAAAGAACDPAVYHAKFDVLCEIEPKFARSWRRTRQDMKDQSASSYDLSLATFAAAALWSDAEIEALLVASRTKHGDDVDKARRPDYLASTIARARSGAPFDPTMTADEREFIDATKPKKSKAAPTDEEDDVRDGALAARLGFTVLRVVKFLGNPPNYELETSSGVVKLGGVESLTSQWKFRDRVVEGVGRMLPKFKDAIWQGVVQALLDLCVDEELAEDATDEGRGKLWVAEYLRNRSVMPTFEEAHDSGAPFLARDSCVCFGGPDLRRYIQVSFNERPTPQAFGQVLRAAGAARTVVGGTVRGAVRQRGVWKLSESASSEYIIGTMTGGR